MKKVLITVAVLSGLSSYAGGFRVSLQGVKQLAMAHTSAHAEDASIAFFNPGGISFIPERLSVAAGGFGAFSKLTYQNTNTLQSYETDNPIGTPIYAAVAYKVLDNVSVGFSFTTPYGSTIQYPENWSGREMVQKMSLKSMYFQPMVSFKLAPWASLGVSYIYATGMVDWDKAATNIGGTVNIKDDKARGSGFGMGFYFRPANNFDIGLAYRSKVSMKADNGVATFNVSNALYGDLGLNAAGQDAFTATLPLPEEYTIGATYKIRPAWKISADFNYTGWEAYDRLTLDFANAPIGNQTDNTILVNPKNFKNSRTFRVGTEYQFTPMIAGRLGYYYDEAAYEPNSFSPETPSFDTNAITGGFGIKFRGFGVDVAAAKTFPKYRSFTNPITNFSGQAKGSTLYIGLGLSYNPF